MKSNLPETRPMTERERLNLAIMIAEIEGSTWLAGALRELLRRHENRLLAELVLQDLMR